MPPSFTPWRVRRGLGEMLETFTRGHVLIAVGGAPFKCPPAPSEAALMMHD